MPFFASSYLILVSSISTAVYFILLTKMMRSWPQHSSNFFLCVTNYAAALLLAPVWIALYRTGQVRLPSAEGWCYFTLAAFLLIVSRELYFYAYSRVDAALITVFSALTPIYALVTGYVFLREIPNLRVVCGIVLVACAIYAVFVPHGRVTSGGRFFFLQPFRRIIGSWPVFCGFLSTIPTAFAAACQKKALYSMDIFSFSLCLFLLTGTIAWLLEHAQSKKNVRPTARDFTITKRASFWWIALLLILMHVCFGPLLMQYHSAVALTLQRSSILFQILLAYFFLNQRDDLPKRAVAGIFILAGLGLLWYRP